MMRFVALGALFLTLSAADAAAGEANGKPPSVEEMLTSVEAIFAKDKEAKTPRKPPGSGGDRYAWLTRERRAAVLLRATRRALTAGRLREAAAALRKLSGDLAQTETAAKDLPGLRERLTRQRRAQADEQGMAGHWPFDEGAGNIVEDATGRGHHGTRNGAKWVRGVIGGALYFNGDEDHVALGNPPGLRITGSMTLSMWLKPETLGQRQNPWAKCYGGEGTLTLEVNGGINYFYGTAGHHAQPYTACYLGDKLAAGSWSHVVIVRDFEAKKMIWYKDGKRAASLDAKYGKAAASALDAYIGKGYVKNYHGLIDDVRLYHRALTPERAAALYRMGQVEEEGE